MSTRLGKILLTIGLVALLSSIVAGRNIESRTLHVEEGNPAGVIFATDRDIHVKLEIGRGNGSFTLYFVYGEDANKTVGQNQSLSIIEPILVQENLTSFNEVIDISAPDIYAFVFTAKTDDYLELDIVIDKTGFNTRLTIAGGILSLLGLILHGHKIIERITSR